MGLGEEEPFECMCPNKVRSYNRLPHREDLIIYTKDLLGYCSWLKQEAKNEIVKPLITFWEGNSRSLKLEKVQTPLGPFLSTELHPCVGSERGCLTAEGEL